jgi:predicted SprT family Zn-dependent metalloprotease
MICFDKALLRSVAEVAFRRSHDKRAIHDAAAGESYQRIGASLELLGGVVERTRGLHHDLAASFDRVNAAYFKGQMSRPRLVWSRTFATRKLAHYEHANDTVMVNIILDKKTVPACAIDFVVYHELLHKHLGVKWKSTRMAAHTDEFAAWERKFQQYDEARAALRKLAAER